MAKHLTSDQQAIALALLEQGRKPREVAGMAGLTYHQVRRLAISRDGYVRDPRGRKPKQ